MDKYKNVLKGSSTNKDIYKFKYIRPGTENSDHTQRPEHSIKRTKE